jgi:hypothetical protein
VPEQTPNNSFDAESREGGGSASDDTDFRLATTAHEELMELLRSLGSDAKGGRIPLAQMREYLAVAKDNAAPRRVGAEGPRRGEAAVRRRVHPRRLISAGFLLFGLANLETRPP